MPIQSDIPYYLPGLMPDERTCALMTRGGFRIGKSPGENKRPRMKSTAELLLLLHSHSVRIHQFFLWACLVVCFPQFPFR